MTKVANLSTNYLSPGSICWAAFLKMGARLENSPTTLLPTVYEELETQFLDAGFVNVRTEVIYDIITGWITKDGSVESVSINGDTDFSEYASYRPDVEVIITYHTFKKNQSD